MATAALTLNVSAVKTNQKVTANLVVTNTGGVPVTVQGVAPFTVPNGAPILMGAPFLIPGGTTIAAGGTLNFSWDLLPVGSWSGDQFVEAMPPSTVYQIGCQVQMSDGTTPIAAAQ